MSTRDELAELLFDAQHPEGFWMDGNSQPPTASYEDIADALIAEGWRKKPSREEMARWVWKRRIGPNGDESFDYLIARAARGVEGVPEGIWDEADAILALMDRGQ